MGPWAHWPMGPWAHVDEVFRVDVDRFLMELTPNMMKHLYNKHTN